MLPLKNIAEKPVKKYIKIPIIEIFEDVLILIIFLVFLMPYTKLCIIKIIADKIPL